MTLNNKKINCDIQLNVEYCYAECQLCRVSFMLNVIYKPFMLNVITLNVVMLSVIMLCVIMLSVIMLIVIMLSVIMLSVIVLSVIILSVMAPLIIG